MDGNTPIDTAEPQFTQREATLISGADAKAINNWIDRGFLKLAETKDRRLTGRRLFSIADIAVIQTMHYCAKLIAIPPSASVEVASVVRQFIAEGMPRTKTKSGKTFKVWHICKVAMFEDEGDGEAQGRWSLQGIWQHPETGAFYHYNPEYYGEDDFTGFPHFPCIMLPTSDIAVRVFLACADLLIRDNGDPVVGDD